ncbi:DUF5994 family protein [Nocardia jiangxiensis]|uniref:DUF5994 family protein n=1 Tax=Nocardia jiangxiensis TaxID=282685 RepID=UPI0003089886|nr:DUF5994 family protein [Nocardia jiangxiensis]
MIDDSATLPITNHIAMGETASTRCNRQPFPSPTCTPRVLLRRPDAGSGLVDGAWWPRTANLTSELHDLINVLTPRLGRLARVGFAWNARSLMQRRIDEDDGVAVHGPALDQPLDTMPPFGTEGASLALLIIPADTEPLVAAQRMRHAAGRWSTMDSGEQTDRAVPPQHAAGRVRHG